MSCFIFVARDLLLHVLFLLLGPLIVVNAKAFCCDATPHVGKSFHDSGSMILAPVLHDCSAVVGVHLHVFVAKEGVQAHAAHPTQPCSHDKHDRVGGWITEPLFFEVIVLLDDFLWVHRHFASELSGGTAGHGHGGS